MVFLNSLRSHPLAGKLGELAPSRVWAKRPSLFFSLCAFTLVASIMLGGGTRGGFLSDTILELFAIPAFLFSLSSLFASPWAGSKRHAEWALMLCVVIVVLPLIQLIPLPPWVWTKLPQREEIVATFDLLGRELPWLPISVSPTSTWISVLSLLPPLAVFLSVIQLGYRERRSLSLVLLGVGLLGTFIGLLQIAQGPSSSLRFFAFTNTTEAVGFFANRNHFAALLYVLLLYAAAWVVDLAFKVGSGKDQKGLETSAIAVMTASLLVLVILMATEAMTRSRAGLGLMIVAVFGVFALILADRRKSTGATPVKLIFVSVIVATVFGVQFALYRILDRFAIDPLEDARVALTHNTFEGAKAYLPFGSGVGTFVTVYPTFEKAHDVIANVYANHAHNDFLEILLEGGVISIMIMAAFAAWYLLRFAKIWRPGPNGVLAIDLLLARAATIVIPLLIAHSLFDYPLRTGAIMAVFAFSCALLVEPLLPLQSESSAELGLVRERSKDLSRLTAPQTLAIASGAPSANAARSLDPAWNNLTAWIDVVDEKREIAAPVAATRQIPVDSAVFEKTDQTLNPAEELNDNETDMPPDVVSEANRTLRLVILGGEKEAPHVAPPKAESVSKISTQIPAKPGLPAAQGVWGDGIEWPEQWQSTSPLAEIAAQPVIAPVVSEKTAPTPSPLRINAEEPVPPPAIKLSAGLPDKPLPPSTPDNDIRQNLASSSAPSVGTSEATGAQGQWGQDFVWPGQGTASSTQNGITNRGTTAIENDNAAPEVSTLETANTPGQPEQRFELAQYEMLIIIPVAEGSDGGPRDVRTAHVPNDGGHSSETTDEFQQTGDLIPNLSRTEMTAGPAVETEKEDEEIPAGMVTGVDAETEERRKNDESKTVEASQNLAPPMDQALNSTQNEMRGSSVAIESGNEGEEHKIPYEVPDLERSIGKLEAQLATNENTADHDLEAEEGIEQGLSIHAPEVPLEASNAISTPERTTHDQRPEHLAPNETAADCLKQESTEQMPSAAASEASDRWEEPVDIREKLVRPGDPLLTPAQIEVTPDLTEKPSDEQILSAETSKELDDWDEPADAEEAASQSQDRAQNEKMLRRSWKGPSPERLAEVRKRAHGKAKVRPYGAMPTVEERAKSRYAPNDKSGLRGREDLTLEEFAQQLKSKVKIRPERAVPAPEKRVQSRYLAKDADASSRSPENSASAVLAPRQKLELDKVTPRQDGTKSLVADVTEALVPAPGEDVTRPKREDLNIENLGQRQKFVQDEAAGGSGRTKLGPEERAQQRNPVQTETLDRPDLGETSIVPKKRVQTPIEILQENSDWPEYRED